MKLSMLEIVNRTNAALKRIDNDIAAAEIGLITVSIGAAVQDDALCQAAKAAIIAELKARKASLELDLKSYGVSLDQAGPDGQRG